MKHRILIVDDESSILYAMTKALPALCDFHGEVTTANNGREAIMETSHCFYDICFLDINLRDSNGLDLIEKINEISPGTNIVVMTAEILPDDMKKKIEKQSSLILPKPVDIPRLKGFLRQKLKGNWNQIFDLKK
jgi:DNA-binding NtrC family response regulator